MANNVSFKNQFKICPRMMPASFSYKFDNKLRMTTQKVAKYTTVADAAGIFQVVSIAHQQAQCQTTVSDVCLTVHEIPSAKVHHGDRFEENIKEGEQAEIVFTLIGEPPFTFTYQRVELEKYVARGKKPRVLETHTVSGITTWEHSIFSSAEGKSRTVLLWQMTDSRQVLGLLRSSPISGADIHQHMLTLPLRKFRSLECRERRLGATLHTIINGKYCISSTYSPVQAIILQFSILGILSSRFANAVAR